MNNLSPTRRAFLANAGSVLGLAAATVPHLAALAKEMEKPRTDEDFWAFIQQSFSSGRGIVNLNNGGVSPSPRIVTEALERVRRRSRARSKRASRRRRA